jgi:hypothetical protein
MSGTVGALPDLDQSPASIRYSSIRPQASPSSVYSLRQRAWVASSRTYENEQVRSRLGVDTKLEKVLVILGEWLAGRSTVVFVREPVGV